MQQEIHFCTTPDNVSIAYSSVGTGPPFIKAANWMSHLEYDWRCPVWKHALDEFSRDHQLIRYDERGTGLSDRKVNDLSLDAFVSDLEAVIDAVGVETFPLLGISQGGPVAVQYTLRHPERVSHLILLGTFATGWKKAAISEAAREKRKAEMTLIQHGWCRDNPAFRQLFTNMIIPDSTTEESQSLTDLQKVSATPENAARIYDAIGDFDVSALLPKLDLPVLVLHSREDAVVPFDEGRRIASVIKGARLVTLESRNHLLMRHERAWPVFVDEVRRFLGCTIASAESNSITADIMRCPQCGTLYSDLSLNYCLEDGTSLLFDSSDDVEATRWLPASS